jgi:hypothetical protein
VGLIWTFTTMYAMLAFLREGATMVLMRSIVPTVTARRGSHAICVGMVSSETGKARSRLRPDLTVEMMVMQILHGACGSGVRQARRHVVVCTRTPRPHENCMGRMRAEETAWAIQPQ